MTDGSQPHEAAGNVIAWRHSAQGQTNVLTVDLYRCLVWHTTRGTWGAVVNGAGTSTAAYNFDTADEAKAWCEQQVAQER